ncbi:MAG TPA: hypothetical protein VI755_05105, partial [Anaerolineales bacterium]|nr:hypothetical protein [Anaerolineales bacterium]
SDPVDWEELKQDGTPLNEPGKLFEWDLSELPAGEVVLRLFLKSVNDTYAELKMRLNLQVPTPTPTPTPVDPMWTQPPTSIAP